MNKPRSLCILEPMYLLKWPQIAAHRITKQHNELSSSTMLLIVSVSDPIAMLIQVVFIVSQPLS